MGEVWRATHRPSGRPVAVKVVRADLAHVPRLVEAYEREIRAVASLDHPRVVEVLAGGVSERGPGAQWTAPAAPAAWLWSI